MMSSRGSAFAKVNSCLGIDNESDFLLKKFKFLISSLNLVQQAFKMRHHSSFLFHLYCYSHQRGTK